MPSRYARSLSPERIIALSVVQDPDEERALHEQWDEYDIPIELHTVSSPYRELTRPVFDFLDEIDQERDDDIITVVIPESVTKVSSQWLHNQSALALKARLLYRPHTVVVVGAGARRRRRRLESPSPTNSGTRRHAPVRGRTLRACE